MPALRCFGLLALTFAVPSLAQRSVVLEEDFSYPDGPLVTVAGGKWKTHSGTAGQAEVSSGRLRLSQKNTEDVSAPFPGGPIGSTNATAVYARFKVVCTGLPSGESGSYFAHFKDAAATTGLRCRIFATTNGAAPGTVRVGIAAAANAASAVIPSNLDLNTGYELVCRMDLSNNLSALWLNPRSEADSHVTSSDSGAVKVAAAFAFRQSLAGGAGMGEFLVDDLVVATDFPEFGVGQAPAILVQPEDQSVNEGGRATFRVAVSGSGPFEYQWFHEGAEIPGATAQEVILEDVTPAEAGRYRVRVSSRGEEVTSAEALLTVAERALSLAVSWAPATGIRVTWTAESGRTYSVWTSDQAFGGFAAVATDLWFPGGLGLFEDRPADAMRFYRVCSP